MPRCLGGLGLVVGIGMKMHHVGFEMKGLSRKRVIECMLTPGCGSI